MKGLVADEIQQGQQEHHPVAEPLLHLVAEGLEHGAVQLNRSLKLLVELLVVQEGGVAQGELDQTLCGV